jgi:xanthine dehydrogenase molybdopterin-binding subunit B
VSHGQQTIPERPDSKEVIGRSLIHRSAYLQTTGEAKFIDDMPSLPGTLHAALVLSTEPHARIKSIGIVLFYSFPLFQT